MGNMSLRLSTNQRDFRSLRALHYAMCTFSLRVLLSPCVLVILWLVISRSPRTVLVLSSQPTKYTPSFPKGFGTCSVRALLEHGTTRHPTMHFIKASRSRSNAGKRALQSTESKYELQKFTRLYLHAKQLLFSGLFLLAGFLFYGHRLLLSTEFRYR